MMRNRPTVVLIHGGPGSYDHSYFKPDFAPLARRAQVVYLDLRDHGRSARHDPADWSFELCADDVAPSATPSASSGRSSSAIRWAASWRCCTAPAIPGHAAGLILQSTFARFDLGRLVSGRSARRRRRCRPAGGARLRRRPGQRRRVGAGLRRLRPGRAGCGPAWSSDREPGGGRARDGPASCARHRRPAPSRRQPDPGLRRCARPVTPVAASREIVGGLPPGSGDSRSSRVPATSRGRTPRSATGPCSRGSSRADRRGRRAAPARRRPSP